MSTRRNSPEQITACELAIQENERRLRQETLNRAFRYLSEQCPRASVLLVAYAIGQFDATQAELGRMLGITQSAISQQLIILRKKLGQFTGRSRE